MTASGRGAAGVLGGLALSAASVLAAALVVEGGLRVAGYQPERYAGTARIFGARNRALLDCYPTNPRGYFDVDLRRPEVLARYEAEGFQRVGVVAQRAPFAVETRLNTHGFRDTEWSPRRPGTLRVVVLGDSFTEGQGVKEPDTYVRQLQSLLEAAEPGRWDVRNGGRRGADFPELFQLFDEVLALEPDLVVHGFVLNDAERTPAFQRRQRYFNDWIVDRRRMAGPEAPRFRPFDSRVIALVRERVETIRIGRESTRWYHELYGEPNREGWEHTQSYFREMDRRMRSRGGIYAVAIWPLLVGLERGYPFADVHHALGSSLGGAGIASLDLLPALQGRSSGELWVHPVDMHPNEVAHRVAAERLAPWVRELGARLGVPTGATERLAGSARPPAGR